MAKAPRIVLAGAALLTHACLAQVVPLSDPLPALGVVPDGQVNRCAFGGGDLYVAGSFATVGVHTGSFALVDRATAEAQRGLPRTDGDVSAVAPDGAGGWYFAGDFTKVEGQPRKNVAHVDAEGNLTAFAPQVFGEVYAMAVDDQRVYLGGDFSSVSGQPRNNLASINRQTGNPTLFDPDVGNAVVSIALVGSSVYFSGGFSTVGGEPRIALAAVESFLGDVLPFAPVTEGGVGVMLVEGDTLYAAGKFATDGGASYRHIASIDLVSGTPDGVVDVSYSHSTSGIVGAMAISGDRLYAVGRFDTLGATARSHAGAINRVTGAIDIWAPTIENPAYYANDPELWAVAADGDTIYLGGQFRYANGEDRVGLAAFGPGPGAPLLPFDATPGGGNGPIPWSLEVEEGTLAVGGRFQIVGDPAPSIATYDLSTGERVPWIEHWPDPSVRSVVVLALAWRDGLVYVGGVADMVSGPDRRFLVALDEASGEIVLDMSLTSDQRQHGHTPSGEQSIAFVGNTLVEVLATDEAIVAFDATTGDVLWERPFTGTINAVIPGTLEDSVLVAGRFDSIGQTQAEEPQGLALVNTVTGDPLLLDLPVNEEVLALERVGDEVYLAGAFTQIDGLVRERLASVDLADPLAPGVTLWEPDPDANVTLIRAVGDTIVVGGNFGMVGGALRPHLAALDPDFAYACEWDPQPNEAPVSLAFDGEVIAAGVPATTSFAGQARPFVGAFDIGLCYADFNGDCALNILDFVAYQNGFSASDPDADCNGDGLLNILDFVCFQTSFQSGCP